MTGRQIVFDLIIPRYTNKPLLLDVCLINSDCADKYIYSANGYFCYKDGLCWDQQTEMLWRHVNELEMEVKTNKIALIIVCTFFVGFYSSVVRAEKVDPLPQISVNAIVRGEGKVGDTAISQNGEVVYVVLDGGIIEIRNTRYKTAQRYSLVKSNENSRNK